MNCSSGVQSGVLKVQTKSIEINDFSSTKNVSAEADLFGYFINLIRNLVPYTDRGSKIFGSLEGY